MTDRPRPPRDRRIARALTEERYRALQTGYREALLTQLDLLVGELLEEGDFAAEQIETAVRIRLDGGPDVLRHHKLAEEWRGEGRTP